MSGTQLLATPGAAFILDVLMKSVVLLLAAGLAALCLRRAAAATRHLIWLCALVALLLLPVLARIVPGIPVSGWSWMVPAILTEAPPSPPPLGLQRPLSTTVAPPTGILLGVYGTGIVLVLWQVILGMVCVRRFEQGSITPKKGSTLLAPCEEAAAAMGVRTPIRLRLSDTAPVPMTWGWHRPTILLPTAAMEWEPERVRVALLHEMAHIARGDWAAQMLSHVVCALYWFHPLVWLAASRLRAESERAADDRVLLAGIPAADYARHLLEIAQSLRVTVTSGVTAMAATPHIEPRLRHLLRAGKRRNAPRVLPTLMAFTMAAILLAGVQADETSTAQVIEPQTPMVTKLEIPSMVPDGVRADGMRIDIFAIGTEDGKRWWKPDGRPMELQKLKEPFVHILPELFTQSKWLHSAKRSLGAEYRHLIFRFQQTAKVRPDIRMTSKATRNTGGVTTWYTRATVPVSKAAKFHSVLWHIPNGPWKEHAVWRVGNPSRRDYPRHVRGRPSHVFPEPVVFFGQKRQSRKCLGRKPRCGFRIVWARMRCA
jgi:beta-lactamase regulating signal transducer with metallopeptidase domain